MITPTTVAVVNMIQLVSVAILCIDKLISLVWYVVYNEKRTMLVYSCIGALFFLFLEKLFPIIRHAADDFTPPFIYEYAFVICAWQILTIIFTDYCFLLKGLTVQKYPKVLTAFFVLIAASRSVCVFCAYFFSLTRFWDRPTWLANNYAAVRVQFDTSANILGLCYNVVISSVFIYEIAKTVRSKEDRLYSILVSAQISLISSLIFETIAVIVMLSVKNDYIFIISDVARAVKTFAVPCQLIQVFLENAGTNSSRTTNTGTKQVMSGEQSASKRSQMSLNGKA